MSTTHTVAQGDTLLGLAKKYGFASVEPILKHEKNEKLSYEKNPERRKTNPNPDILTPGEQIFIPDIETAHFTVKTGERHTFLRRPMKDYIPVYLSFWCVDDDGAPYAGKDYRLDVEGDLFTGTTGEKGELSAGVNPKAEKARLTVFPSPHLRDLAVTWNLVIKPNADEANKVKDDADQDVVLGKPGVAAAAASGSAPKKA